MHRGPGHGGESSTSKFGVCPTQIRLRQRHRTGSVQFAHRWRLERSSQISPGFASELNENALKLYFQEMQNTAKAEKTEKITTLGSK